MTDRYVVAGNPVAHSRSPEIHAAFARQTAQDLEYGTLLIEIGCFADQATRFFVEGGKGMNVTLPFKVDAYELAPSLSRTARQAGAVNTLMLRADGRLHGDNTDGIGMVRDLRDNLGWTLAGRSVLLLGAGGAVRGVLGPLLAEHPRAVIIANRTPARAEQLARAFGKLGTLAASDFDSLKGPFDLVINGTSASLRGAVPALPVHAVGPRTACYDMAYGDEPTAFLRWAASAGVGACADGLGMLVEQAAESFLLWRGVRPLTAPVIAGLRAAMSQLL
jgi:shikimate dehydrogenase